MKPAEYGNSPRMTVRRQLSGLPIVNPAPRPAGFPYGYLARLIDDRELSEIGDPAIRAATRLVHREVYWHSLRLLSRDVKRMRTNRRRLMEARGAWNFESLISETVQVQKLLWTLRLAGAAHAVYVPSMAASAREACAEIARIMAAPAVTLTPAVREA